MYGKTNVFFVLEQTPLCMSKKLIKNLFLIHAFALFLTIGMQADM